MHADQPAPTNPAALVFLTTTKRPTFRAEFKPGEGGKKMGAAVYMARWINTRGEKGLWLEIATATVAASAEALSLCQSRALDDDAGDSAFLRDKDTIPGECFSKRRPVVERFGVRKSCGVRIAPIA